MSSPRGEPSLNLGVAEGNPGWDLPEEFTYNRVANHTGEHVSFGEVRENGAVYNGG